MEIRMSDGCRLSARVWMPEDASEDPVPVIVEHLPYRKRDGTVVRDCLTHPWLAGHGYACIRTDMRGNGDSEGLMEDEYTSQELQDACEVIAWATAQPWSNGKAGMMGISWGGFNCLQVASLRPSALKAVVSLCSTVDRFADDIHYKGGCLLSENFGWAATMLSYSSRPPDPLLVGDGWRELWLQRLQVQPFLLSTWLRHQSRDGYWQHGSICEDYSQIKAAVLAVGGWHDGYRNTISHLVSNICAPVKGIVGPWIHKYPHFAAPEPRIGFLQEMLRWWDRWLKDKDTGVDNDPDYRAYIMDSVVPQRWFDQRPGRWVSEKAWPSNDIATIEYHLGEQGQLIDQPAAIQQIINSPLDCGLAAGEYFPFTYGPELPDNQLDDDARSACFDSDVLSAAIDIIGAPTIRLRLSADKPMAQLIVRLCDLRADGSSAFISLGVLNLTHRHSHATPQLLNPGEEFEVTIALDQVAYRIPAGSKLRIAISTCYWPLIWPAPERASVTLMAGSLALPHRQQLAERDEWVFEPPQSAPPWQHENLWPTASTREIIDDAETGAVTTLIENDFGEDRDLEHGLISGSKVTERWSIKPDDPLSAQGEIHWLQTTARDNWVIKTEAIATMHCDRDFFYLRASLQAWENGELVFKRGYDDQIARQYV